MYIHDILRVVSVVDEYMCIGIGIGVKLKGDDAAGG